MLIKHAKGVQFINHGDGSYYCRECGETFTINGNEHTELKKHVHNEHSNTWKHRQPYKPEPEKKPRGRPKKEKKHKDTNNRSRDSKGRFEEEYHPIMLAL